MAPASSLRFQSHLFTGLAGFAAGVLLTWFAMRGQPVQAPAPAPVSTPMAETGISPGAANQSPAEAALTLGNTYYDQKRWGEAIAQYQFAIAGGIDNPDVHTDLGNCFRFTGVPAKALEQYRLAQTQDPRHEHSLFNTATLYTEVLHDTPKALETWREYLKRFPQGANVPMAQHFIDEHSAAAAGAASVQTPSKPANADVVEWMKSQQGDPK